MDSLPFYTRRRRRLVPPDKRKKASFLCDRCKTRKIACQRNEDGRAVTCTGCTKAGVKCTTTIQRKKRKRSPVENIGLHYRCLVALVALLHPEVDVNNIDAVIALGERLGVKMPSRYGGELDGDLDFGFLLSAARDCDSGDVDSAQGSSPRGFPGKIEPESGHRPEIDSTPLPPFAVPVVEMRRPQHNSLKSALLPLGAAIALESTGSVSTVVAPPASLALSSAGVDPANSTTTPVFYHDLVVLDSGGNTHCIGALGAPGILHSYLRAVDSKTGSHVPLSQLSHAQRISAGDPVISSKQPPLQHRDLLFLHLHIFPIYREISEAEARRLVDVFFEKLHPRLLCFVEVTFREGHDRFWVSANSSTRDNSLTNHVVCAIYMVWILTQLHELTPVRVAVDDETTQKYLHIVKLCLSDILMVPSLDGVRALLLLSIYMDNRMRRETGYVLVEAASLQAITLGLHRHSYGGCSGSAMRAEEARRTWWAVYLAEATFSIQMGRLLCINQENIDATFPAFLDLAALGFFMPAYAILMDSTRILHEIMRYRTGVTEQTPILSQNNVARALFIDSQIAALLADFVPELHDFASFPEWRMPVHYRIHYTRLLLTLPVLVYTAGLLGPEFVATLDLLPICQLLNAAVLLCLQVASLIQASVKTGSLNGTMNPEIFYVYHATIGLVAAYLILREVPGSLSVTLVEIETALDAVAALDLCSRSIGTLHKIALYVEAFSTFWRLIGKQPDTPTDIFLGFNAGFLAMDDILGNYDTAPFEGFSFKVEGFMY